MTVRGWCEAQNYLGNSHSSQNSGFQCSQDYRVSPRGYIRAEGYAQIYPCTRQCVTTSQISSETHQVSPWGSVYAGGYAQKAVFWGRFLT